MFHFNLQVYIFNSIQSPFPLYCYLLYFLWLFSKCWPDNTIVNALSGLTDKIVWVAMPLQPVLWFMAIIVHHPSLLYTLLITTDSTFCEFCLSFQPWYYIKASPSLNQSFINLTDRFRSHRSPLLSSSTLILGCSYYTGLLPKMIRSRHPIMRWINASYKQTWVVCDNGFKNTEMCKFLSVHHPKMIHFGSWASHK